MDLLLEGLQRDHLRYSKIGVVSFAYFEGASLASSLAFLASQAFLAFLASSLAYLEEP